MVSSDYQQEYKFIYHHMCKIRLGSWTEWGKHYVLSNIWHVNVRLLSRGDGNPAESTAHMGFFALMAQLKVTANTMLPAIARSDSWVICVTTTVTDTHHFRRGQCGESRGVKRKPCRTPARASKQQRRLPRRCGRRTSPVTQEKTKKQQRGCLFLSAVPLNTVSTLLLISPAVTQKCR